MANWMEENKENKEEEGKKKESSVLIYQASTPMRVSSSVENLFLLFLRGNRRRFLPLSSRIQIVLKG